MKTLHKINLVLLWSTIALYITFFGGLLMQILLGAYQIVLAIIVLVKYYPLISSSLVRGFNIYLILVLAFGFVVLVFYQIGRIMMIQDLLIFLFFSFSMGLAIYQVTLTKRIRNYLREKSFEL